jgi:hypothetical protein
MAKLNKVSNGLLFFDDFKEKTLMWTLSPSNANCLAFGEDGLQIKHNRNYTSYTIVEPNLEEYSCIVHLDHTPVNLYDIAGIIVMSNSKEYAECQSYMATGPSELGNAEQYEVDTIRLIHEVLTGSYAVWSKNEYEPELTPKPSPDLEDEFAEALSFVDMTYPWIKFTKLKYKYIFWASTDGITWIEVGNVKFNNSGVIGFFVYGTKDNDILKNGHCFFKSFAIYNSKYITFENIDRNYECEIIDGEGRVVVRTDAVEYAHMINRSNTQLLINTITTPMPIRHGTLRIYPKREYETTVGSYYLGEETYGGDTFNLERDIRLYIDNKEINPLNLYDLGTFYCGSHYIKVDVHNHEDYVVGDIKIKVIKYSEYYGGEEEVGLALYNKDNSNIPEKDLEYTKEIVIDEIIPSEGRSFYMKLTDVPVQDFFNTAHSYRFKIVIE